MHRCHSHLHQSINNLGFLNTVISLKKINVRLFHNLIYVALQKITYVKLASFIFMKCVNN